jgi:hypothetical protein
MLSINLDIGFEVFIHTNHSSIQYIVNNFVTNGRITRWILLLQEFNITIIDKPRKENMVHIIFLYLLMKVNLLM